MVGILKLILDDFLSICTCLSGIDIYIKVANTWLGFIYYYLQTNSIKK